MRIFAYYQPWNTKYIKRILNKTKLAFLIDALSEIKTNTFVYAGHIIAQGFLMADELTSVQCSQENILVRYLYQKPKKEKR